ncbi:hypothetical protein K440DRAFT_405358 [Wilcoxina mikolae CBS 423.85]|nr:hypothetical protein K440DRAFT_405358 [Wilcoxina mikolae CBS 423.85]
MASEFLKTDLDLSHLNSDLHGSCRVLLICRPSTLQQIGPDILQAEGRLISVVSHRLFPDAQTHHIATSVRLCEIITAFDHAVPESLVQPDVLVIRVKLKNGVVTGAVIQDAKISKKANSELLNLRTLHPESELPLRYPASWPGYGPSIGVQLWERMVEASKSDEAWRSFREVIQDGDVLETLETEVEGVETDK